MDNRFCSPLRSQSAVHPRCGINDVGIAHNHKTPARATPKVVQIPVRFVNSEPSKPNSALKIQKVFRGFLIRSRVKKILELKKKANEIEDRMSRSETVELIQRDQRERLRINEMLMSLLFKLDSVGGVDAGVRDCRKAVIKKVISLQERLDSISDQIQSISPGESQDNESSADEVVGSALFNPADESNRNLLDNEIRDSENNVAIKEPDSEIWSAEEEKCFNNDAAETKSNDEGNYEKCFNNEAAETKSNDEENYEKCFNNEAAETKSNDEENYDTSRDEFEEAKSEEDTSVVKETGEIQNIKGTHSVAENKTMSMMGEEENGGGQKKEEEEEEEMNNQKVLKRLMEDNQTMMNMMTQLFERNELQTQMLNTLRNKVELLERAFVCDRLRKKKKRQSS